MKWIIIPLLLFMSCAEIVLENRLMGTWLYQDEGESRCLIMNETYQSVATSDVLGLMKARHYAWADNGKILTMSAEGEPDIRLEYVFVTVCRISMRSDSGGMKTFDKLEF
jgi:hypothetical protein